MNYQWYPGHMAKAKHQMQEDIKLIDVVIELVDARIPYSSKNPDIDELAKGKSRIILLNKADMADKVLCQKWAEYYEKKGFYAGLIDSKSGKGVKTVLTLVQKACAAKLERDRARGILNRPCRAMIVGIPNVGKSTFINSLVGKNCAKTGNKPGVTKGKQWIRVNKSIELLDTPGILWPKFEDQRVGMRIAFIGSINEDILSSWELARCLSPYLYKEYPGVMNSRYGIEEAEDGEETILRVAVKRACMLKGGTPDVEKAASFIMDDFRSARIGLITLEKPEDRE